MVLCWTRRWLLGPVLIAGVGGCGGGSGPTDPTTFCSDNPITPLQFTRPLPPATRYLPMTGGTLYNSFYVEPSDHPDDYVDLTIETECVSGDCVGAYVFSNPPAISVLIPGRVQGRLDRSHGVLSYAIENATPPKEATVIVRFSGTRHSCFTEVAMTDH